MPGKETVTEQTTARRALVAYMSELSESYWAATWMAGWERDCRPGDRFAAHENLTLRLLSAATAGWWPESYEDAARYLHGPTVEEGTDHGA